MYQLGYNTNGFAHHRWQDAFAILSELGYRSVAITIDHNCLNPFSPQFEAELSECERLLEEHELGCVIETGARFLLNPRQKHEPTLLHPETEQRALRQEFLSRCVEIATRLNADAVSFWAGVPQPGVPRDVAWRCLVDGCRELLAYANQRNVKLGFEPEPGMLVETMADYERLCDDLAAAEFGLTLDVGHLQCTGELPIGDVIRNWRTRLCNVHIEDMQTGVHDHLRFGEGEIDFEDVMNAFRETNYGGGLHVELSRHSHMAPTVARESYEFLSRFDHKP